MSLVLNAVVKWTRRQTGTSSLRALVYMDEVFGYLPPVANPSSKLPRLTQARAFGVGLVLATQNPVDLDYKALSNTGTWFLGKLQTERDKARMLDGLDGVSSGLDRQAIDRALSSLRGRVFLMHNVHEQAPIAFETRWALSYLRGPMGREELRRFARAPLASSAPTPPPIPTSAVPPPAASSVRPVVPAGIEEYVLPSDGGIPSEYAPVLYGAARVQYTDTKRGIDVTRSLQAIVSFVSGPVPVDWERAEATTHPPETLTTPAAGPAASHLPLPPAALDKKRYAVWTKGVHHMGGAGAATHGLLRAGDETRVEAGRVRARLSGAHPARRTRSARRRCREAPTTLRAESGPASGEGAEGGRGGRQGAAAGVTAESADGGVARRYYARRADGSPCRLALDAGPSDDSGARREPIAKESQDVARAQQRLQEARAELAALDAEVQGEVAALEASSSSSVAIERSEIKPKRGGVEVRIVALAWKPMA